MTYFGFSFTFPFAFLFLSVWFSFPTTMEKFDNPPTPKEMKALREGIKKKYKVYHLLDRDRFPEFEYNTNRANYEPLRESFEEEFFVTQGFDTSDRNIHIPSTNTLTQLFCDEYYLPGKKILNTCQTYADELSSRPGIDNTLAENPLVVAVPAKIINLFLAGMVLVAILFVFIISKPALDNAPPASGLILTRPSQGRVVPRELLAAGNVSNAKTVWVVVRPKGSKQYFVQPPMKVGDDHTWRGVIYVGSVNSANVGLAFEVRAFVNPVTELKEGDLLYSWPQAELTTGVVEVIRGAQTE